MKREALLFAAALLLGVCALQAHAVTCTVAASMPATERDALFDATHGFGQQVIDGQSATLKSEAIPSFAANFGDVENAVSSLAPQLKDATLTVTNLYGLDASDLKAIQDDVQFFCGVPGAQLLVTITLGTLPPGRYALALLHATDVKEPQQFALILQNTASAAAPRWLLAGFFERPLTMAGHDSIWFWQQARTLKQKNENWSAFFYDQASAYLARPSDLYTSPNLEKLSRETASVEPPGLPGQRPMMLAGDGQSFAVTGLRVDDGLGALDLRVDVQQSSVADPVAARRDALAVMEALLKAHAGLRGSFHGLWVYETTPSGQSFAVEQPMSALP